MDNTKTAAGWHDRGSERSNTHMLICRKGKNYFLFLMSRVKAGLVKRRQFTIATNVTCRCRMQHETEGERRAVLGWLLMRWGENEDHYVSGVFHFMPTRISRRSVDSWSSDRLTVTKALHQDIWPDKDSSLHTQMRLYRGRGARTHIYEPFIQHLAVTVIHDI